MLMTLAGVIGLKQVDSEDEDKHIEDSVRIVAQAFAQLMQKKENISEAPTSCALDSSSSNGKKNSFASGRTIFE